jgi:hypothetical protein
LLYQIQGTLRREGHETDSDTVRQPPGSKTILVVQLAQGQVPRVVEVQCDDWASAAFCSRLKVSPRKAELCRAGRSRAINVLSYILSTLAEPPAIAVPRTSRTAGREQPLQA